MYLRRAKLSRRNFYISIPFRGWGVLSSHLQRCKEGRYQFVLGVFLSSRNHFTDNVEDSYRVLLKTRRGLAIFSTCMSGSAIRRRLSSFCGAISTRSRILLYDSLCKNDIGRSVCPCLRGPGAHLIDNIGVAFVVGILYRRRLSSRQLRRVLRRDHDCLHEMGLRAGRARSRSFFWKGDDEGDRSRYSCYSISS